MPGLVVSMPPPSPQGAPGAPGPGPTQLPGLVVSTPGPAAPPVGAPVAPPSGPRPPEAKAKPKPKPAVVKEANADGGGRGGKSSPQGIVALVNDEPVTAYEVDQLASFLTLSANYTDRAKANMKVIAENPKTNERLQQILKDTIAANPGKSREQVIAAFEVRKKDFVISLQKQAVESAKSSMIPGLRKKALEELIEDRLKFQEAKRLTVAVNDEESDKAFKNLADRNKMTPEQFSQFIKAQGGDPAVMKARFRSQFAWREVIRRRYGHMITVSNKEVDQFVANSKQGGADTTELQLHKITLASPGKLDQTVMAQRLNDAEALRAKFTACKDTASLAKSATGAKFEDLGYKNPSSLEEPMRSFLAAAKDGDMLPANFAAAGVELYAVCGRRNVKISDDTRAQAENIIQMKEFERLATRHLQDIKKDAMIEIK